MHGAQRRTIARYSKALQRRHVPPCAAMCRHVPPQACHSSPP
ncbi:MAG: hypothetical protein P8179_17225 [Candidatus Thiodiazotropha sp.]